MRNDNKMEYDNMLISETASVIDAMAALDKCAKKVLFIVNDNILKAAITDGDIRRWILAKGNLEEEIKNVANYKPKFLYEKNHSHAREYMKEKHLDALPIVNETMEIIEIIFIYDDKIKKLDQNLNLPVVIMAGGLGTRLYPYTKILPKPLIPIGDIPITEHIINKFYEWGCKEFYLVVNHKKNMIKAYFNDIEKDYSITYIDEDKPLGTGGGISLLKGMIHSTFILTNCDTIIEEDYAKMYKQHISNNNVVTMICSLKNFIIPYGVVEIGENGCIDIMKEKPHLSFFINTGCYIVEPEIIEDLPYDTPFSFPDIVQKYKKDGRNVGVYPISEHAWMDMGQFDTMEEMRTRLEEHNE